jgi:hypothetical protein
MITSAVIGVFLAMVSVVINLWPIQAAELPEQVTDFFVTIQSGFEVANLWFPVSELLIAVGIFLTVELAIFSIKGIMIIYRMIRG